MLGPIRQPPHYPDAAARQALLVQAVGLSQHLHACLTPYLPEVSGACRRLITRILAALVKVVADELTTDAAGQWVERPTRQRGEHRIASAVDLDATFRKHEGSPAVLGTNAVISTTATRIRASVALTGSIPDGEAPTAALQQQRDANLPLPPHMVMDQIGGWGKCRARTYAVSDRQTQMVARIPVSGGSDPTRSTVADFQIDLDGTTCTCPGGGRQHQAFCQRRWRRGLLPLHRAHVSGLCRLGLLPRSEGQPHRAAQRVHQRLPPLPARRRHLQ